MLLQATERAFVQRWPVWRARDGVCAWTGQKYQRISFSGPTSWSLHLEPQTGFQQVDGVGGGEDEGGGETVAGDHQS